MSIRHLLLAGASALVLTACGNKAEEEAATVEEVVAEAEAEGQIPAVEAAEAAIDAQLTLSPEELLARSEAYLAENAAKEGVEVTASGLQFETLEAGDGRAPIEDDVIVMHFVGIKADGTVFDTSLARGTPTTIQLSSFKDEAPGFVEGVMKMNVGGAARFTLPPALAYGTEGTPDGVIGPNEALTFEVQLLDAIDAETVAKMEAEYKAIADTNKQAGDAFLAANAAKSSVQVTESGLQYEVLEKGNSTVSPTAADTVEVHYRGTVEDGTVFDSSYDRGETTTFPLGNVIRGWTEGLQLMNEGDKYRFYIPSDLAYGAQSRGEVIGPNQMLIFDVELVDVKEPAAAE
ncbi:FKBP-type peptidyl-prolyl cis-trans isomerase [Parvularcula sp. IMCC14364]|uniref:FKBP-type peptidyl-prolyl cis-trans isomerase n=1 Tax=Parvularcula sp. IMCC14364 TaxID=3067902 RepID=UPI0027409095|nr:FKBP-type peptidyl-prolyl cis-trans isomerase [Parvularcula sp. IMCC14364]